MGRGRETGEIPATLAAPAPNSLQWLPWPPSSTYEHD